MTAKNQSPQIVLQQLIQGFQISQAIYVAARLGIADLLKDGPRSSEDLAQETKTHTLSLYRVLRLLSALGLLTEGEARTFALTSLGSYLQTDVAGSLRSTTLAYGDTAMWQVWGALLHSVETGEPSYEYVFGLPNWEYRARHPEAGTLFDAFMTEWTIRLAPFVAAAYDFSTTDTLVDVGGGHGQLLATILQTYPSLHGVLFDLPHVVQGAASLLEAAQVSKRCEMIGGDVFVAVPTGYETYLLSRVIHDWDDESALAILTRCHQAMKSGGQVLLVERVIPNDQTPEPLVLQMDVHMLVATGGKERTEDEYRQLLTAAGFELTTTTPVWGAYSMLVATHI